jgi:hypothetical protein
MIRQLLDTGGSREDIEAIPNTIPQDGDAVPHNNDEDSSLTTSSESK